MDSYEKSLFRISGLKLKTNGHLKIAWKWPLLAALILPGCELHPLLRPSVRDDLRSADLFEPPDIISEPVVKLDDTPPESSAEVVTRAKLVVDPDSKLPMINLTLSEIRKSALENNLELQVAEFDSSISEETYRVEEAKFESILATAASYGESYDVVNAKTKNISLEPSVQIPTRLGRGGVATISLPFTQSDSDSLNPFGQPAGKNSGAGLRLGISQPLLRDAGWDVDHFSIKVAGLQMRQADAQVKLSAIRVLATAERSYWDYYAAYENLKIRIEEYDVALEQLRMAKRLVEEGVRTNVEVIRQQAGVASRLGNVILAENARRRAERALKSVINQPDLPVESETVIYAGTPPNPIGLVFDRGKVIELAYGNRMELFQNEVQRIINRLSLEFNDNQKLPSLNFEFTYSFSGSAPSFSKALNRIFKNELNEYIVGLRAEIPLQGNLAAQARFRESVLQQAQTLTNRRLLRLMVRQEVSNAVDAVELNWQRILSERTSVEIVQKAYEAELIQFQLGVVTGADLLQALTRLTAARSLLVSALQDYHNSIVDLAFATGTVLGQGGVIWTPATADPDEETPPSPLENGYPIPEPGSTHQQQTLHSSAEMAPAEATSTTSSKAERPGSHARKLIDNLENGNQPIDLDTMYHQADQLGKEGRSTDAYLLYFYAAKRGQGDAAFKLAQRADPATFKPDFSMFKTPSLMRANKWYQQAAKAGHLQAKHELTRLHAEIAQSAADGDEVAQRLMLQLQELQGSP